MKKNYNQNILGGKLIATIIVSVSCLMVTGYWYSYTGESEKGEAQEGPAVEETIDNQDSKAQDMDKKKSKKPNNNKKEKRYKKFMAKIENEDYVIFNPGTSHEYKAFKKTLKAEREPDLSRVRFYPEVSSKVLPGEEVSYVVELENKGNIKASGFDLMVELDSRFSDPENIKISGCGRSKKLVDVEGGLGISNLDLKMKKGCAIRFKVTPNIAGNLVNYLYISASAEGGEEIGPIESVAVTVRGEEIPVIEDVLEESDESEITPISGGEIDQSRTDEDIEDEATPVTEGEIDQSLNEESAELIEAPAETVLDESEPQSEEEQATEEPELTEEVTEEVAEEEVAVNPEI